MKDPRLIPAFVLIFLLSTSGCTTLGPNDMASHGYQGTPEIWKGNEIPPVDILGNVFSAFGKLILWNDKVNNHYVSDETENAVRAYLDKYGKELGNLEVEINRYAPGDAFRRLFTNSGVGPFYRYTFGLLTVLIGDTLLVNRLFGYDSYNPYTHTVYIHSDIPALALYQLARARDYSLRRWRGSYATSRWAIVPDIAQLSYAGDLTFDYLTENNLSDIKADGYRTLYPQLGNYPGIYLWGIGNIVGGILGHPWGRYDEQLESKSPGPFYTKKDI